MLPQIYFSSGNVSVFHTICRRFYVFYLQTLPNLDWTGLDPRQCRSTDDPPNLLLCSWRETYDRFTGKGVTHVKEAGCWLKRILAPLTSEPEMSVCRMPDQHAFLKTSSLSEMFLEWLNAIAVCWFLTLKTRNDYVRRRSWHAVLSQISS